MPRPADAMRALDVVVHASTDPEPFGLVVAEAMACGRAVTTSGTGGASELIERTRRRCCTCRAIRRTWRA
jgi:glycosyltransferase involved in cell wall biosynthesis